MNPKSTPEAATSQPGRASFGRCATSLTSPGRAAQVDFAATVDDAFLSDLGLQKGAPHFWGHLWLGP